MVSTRFFSEIIYYLNYIYYFPFVVIIYNL